MINLKRKTKGKRILKHLGNIGLSIISISLMTTPVSAMDAAEAANQAVAAEGGKEAINTVLKAARSKPAMSTATMIVCLACAPVAGVAVSPGMCVACGILIAKTIG